MKLLDFVVTDALLPDTNAETRDEVIRQMVEALVDAGAAPKNLTDELIKLILDREKHGSTGFGKGVAVPHVKHDQVKHMAGCIAISPNGIDFNALDKQPVYSIFLLLSPKNKPEEHLQAMEVIFSNLQKDTFRRFLRQSSTREELEELLKDADAQQLSN